MPWLDARDDTLSHQASLVLDLGGPASLGAAAGAIEPGRVNDPAVAASCAHRIGSQLAERPAQPKIGPVGKANDRNRSGQVKSDQM